MTSCTTEGRGGFKMALFKANARCWHMDWDFPGHRKRKKKKKKLLGKGEPLATESYWENNIYQLKLDGVGPVDNTPSTD